MMDNLKRNFAHGLRAILLAFSVLIVLLPAGCGQKQSFPKVVRIGAVYPLSGALQPTGADIQHGIELAVEIINNEYDLEMPLAKDKGLSKLGGAKIEVVFADHAGDAGQGVVEAARLINDEKVVALVGAYNSAVTAQASQAAEAAGVPFLNPESTSVTLTQRGYKWFFRTTADDAIFVKNFFDFLNDLKSRRGISVTDVAVVYENTLFGTGVGQLEIQYAEQAGITVAADVLYAAKADNIDAEVQRVVAANAAVVMQTSYDSDAIKFMQAYKQNNYRPQAILGMNAGFISPSFVATLGEDANYVLSREVWALDLANARPLVQKVNDLFFQRYGVNMTGNSARAFTGMIALPDAINRGGVTPGGIRTALLATDIPGEQLIMPWDGIRFDPTTGQNTLARGIIVQIQDQKYYTVWPWELASRDLIWPMP